MTTLEQRIAEAVRGAQVGARSGADDDYFDYIARAVVAVLPTGDVTDEQIVEALEQGDDSCVCRDCLPIHPVHQLFTAQATAHAVEMDALRALLAEKDATLHTALTYNSSLSRQNAKFEADRDAALARVRELEAEVERHDIERAIWVDEALTRAEHAEAQIQAVRAIAEKGMRSNGGTGLVFAEPILAALTPTEGDGQ